MKERVRNLRLVTLNLDYDDVKEFKEIIGKDFSKAVRDMIRQELDNQKKVAGQENLPIFNCQTTIEEQHTLDKYFPSWILNYKDWQNQNHIQDSLSPDERREALIMLRKTTERWRSRL